MALVTWGRGGLEGLGGGGNNHIVIENIKKKMLCLSGIKNYWGNTEILCIFLVAQEPLKYQKKIMRTGDTVSHIKCYVLCVTCHLSPVICHLSSTPTVTARDRPHYAQ